MKFLQMKFEQLKILSLCLVIIENETQKLHHSILIVQQSMKMYDGE